MRYQIAQVYYDDATLKNCYEHECVLKILNGHHTDYFENSIISGMQDVALRYDFFAVWSHAHKYKIHGHPIDFNRLEGMMEKFDLIAFQRMLRNGRIFSGAVQRKYQDMFNKIMEALKMKYRFPKRPKFVVMQNHFITRGYIFKDYCESVLDPAIRIMDNMPEASERVDYRGKAKSYNFKPFLCEKLMSAYIEERNLKCAHW